MIPLYRRIKAHIIVYLPLRWESVLWRHSISHDRIEECLTLPRVEAKNLHQQIYILHHTTTATATTVTITTTTTTTTYTTIYTTTIFSLTGLFFWTSLQVRPGNPQSPRNLWACSCKNFSRPDDVPVTQSTVLKCWMKTLWITADLNLSVDSRQQRW